MLGFPRMKGFFSKLITPLSIILLAAILRIAPHSANFAPISAMALFGGANLNRKWAILVPLAAMLISDYLLLYINPFANPIFNFTKIYHPQALIHDTIIAIYISFLISGLVGLWLKKHKSVQNVIAAALFCSIQFFLISNAAVWIMGMYDRSIIGLYQSYIAAIPFFRGTFIGDLFYTGLFFGAYEFVHLKFHSSLRHSELVSESIHEIK